MGSILMGDLDDRLTSKPDLDTAQGRCKLAAGRLTLLMLVMATRSLAQACEETHTETDNAPTQQKNADYRQAG